MFDTEMTIIKHKKEVDFTTIYNDCINDRKLKTDSLAILVYVMSKPDDWEIKIKEISNRFSLGRDSVDRAIKCLVSAGYMRRVQKRVCDGSFARLVIYASDKPMFLEETQNKQQPEIQGINITENTNKQPFTEIQETVTVEKTDKQPFTENPLTVFQETIPYIQNKDLTKNNNNNLSTTRENAPASNGLVDAVVVFLLNKIRNLPNFDISEEQMDEWVIKYGRNFVEEKIELMRSKSKVLSQGAYLRSALMYDWKKTTNSVTSSPQKIEIQVPCSNPDKKLTANTTYNSDWFMALSAEQKKKVYESSLKAYPTLELALNSKGESVLDKDFDKSCWFKPMIDSFRSYCGLR